MLRSQCSSLAILAALLPTLALAQDEPAAVTLDPVVLSAGLSPVAESAYGRAYTVITAEDIAAHGNRVVEDALRDVPGLSLTSTGDTMTKVRIRGSEYNHVLVLIDGVEANTSNYGEYVFSGMLTDDIARIEVLRGPQSTIYGANAAAGVISITTRKATEPGLHYGGSAEIGGLNTRAASAWVEARGERGALSFTAASRRTDGEDASRTPGGDTEFNNRDLLSLSGSYQLTETVSVGFALRRTWQEFGYDSSSWSPVPSPDDYIVDAPLTDDRNETYGTLWLEAEAFDGRMLNRLTASGMNQTNDYFNNGLPDYDDASRLRDLKYVATWGLDGIAARESRQKLNVAFEKKRETYESSFAAGRYERDTTSVALEYQGRFDNGASVQAGLRRDMNDVFGDGTSWSLAGAWQVPDRDLTLRAAAGKAIVNPDMFQQYGYIPGSFHGNPDLKPETNLGYEIGADWGFASGRGRLGATVFDSKVKDMITGAGETSVNIDGTSTRKGVELSFDFDATDWLRIGANYTYTDARSAEGKVIPRQPRHQFGLRATGDFAQGRGQVSADLRYVADNYDEEWFNTVWPALPATTELPDFVTVNVAARYDLTEQLELNGRIVNLFDEDYSEAWGYYGQGRTAYLGLSAKW